MPIKESFCLGIILPVKESSHLCGKGATKVEEKMQFGEGELNPRGVAIFFCNICITSSHIPHTWEVCNTHLLNESNNLFPNLKYKQKLH